MRKSESGDYTLFVDKIEIGFPTNNAIIEHSNPSQFSLKGGDLASIFLKTYESSSGNEVEVSLDSPSPFPFSCFSPTPDSVPVDLGAFQPNRMWRNLFLSGDAYFLGSLITITADLVAQNAELVELKLEDNKGSNYLTIQDTRSNNGDNVGVKFGTYTGITKSMISHVETDSLGVGDMVFSVDTETDSGDVSLTDEKMRIKSDGKVGIGTSTPTTKFEVNGDSKISGDLEVTGDVKGSHLSSDGTAGANGTIDLTTVTSITVKDGLITEWS